MACNILCDIVSLPLCVLYIRFDEAMGCALSTLPVSCMRSERLYEEALFLPNLRKVLASF